MSKISLKHSGGNVVSLNSPTNAPSAADVAFKLPNQDGSANEFLKTDGSGNLSFAAAGGGKFLQIVSTTKTDTFSADVASGSFSGDAISVSITPSNANNKILITAIINMGCESSVEGKFQIFKAGSVLTGATGDASGTNTRVTSMSDEIDGTGQQTNISGQFLDTAGGTSSITYSIRLGHGYDGTRYVYLNRSHQDTSGGADSRATSNITVMEVAA